MTHFERLIQAHTQTAVVTTLSGATERIAEEMARDLLKDRIFRTEMQAFIRKAFSTTIIALARNGKPVRRRKRARR